MNIYAFADEASGMIDRQIAAMVRNGLNGLEIRNVDGQNVSDISLEKAAEVREKLDAAGLTVWSIGSPLGKIGITGDDFDAHMEKLRHTLEVAKVLGAKNIRLFSFYIPGGEAAETYRDEVIRRLRCFVQAAEGTGIDLCHENEKGIYGDNAARCLDILQAVPELKAVFDPANFVQCGQDTLEAWELLRPYVKYMHIKDALADGAVVPAGKGIGHVQAIVAAFRAQGGDALSIEPHLTVFEGLKDLEQSGNTSEVGRFAYPSSDAAFDAACEALKEISMKKVRLGIIGVGNMGSGHLKNILSGLCPEIEVTALADRRASRREFAKQQLPEAAIFTEGSDLIASGACEAVLIATPHYQHPTLAEEAFEHGLHVMVEKPAGVYTLQAREMNAAADRHPDLTFGMMFNQRTNCVYRKMKEMLESGELGEFKRVSWLITDWYRTQFYYDSGAWRATWAGEGGGVLLNQCPHQLDLLQWLCGLPATVRAFCHEGKWHDVEVEDDVTAYLEFQNGATGVFVTTTGDAPGTNRLEITGTKGKLVCEHDVLTFEKLAVDEREWCATCQEGFTKPPKEVITVSTDGRNVQHPEVLNCFAANILRGEPLVADGREGINGLMLSNAMHLSSWLGHEVSLPIDEKQFYDLLMARCQTSRHKEEADVTLNTENSY